MQTFYNKKILLSLQYNISWHIGFAPSLYPAKEIVIYIITVLVGTSSLCGFVASQVQNNMESAQYLGKSYYILMIIDKYILDIYI